MFPCKPAAGNITEFFGPRPKPTPSSPALHYGLDFGWGGGLDVFAVAAGVVESVAEAGSYGLRVTIRHSAALVTWYCHLSDASVARGDQVAPGQRIATMGDSGNVTATHLHFEVRVNGVAVDPLPYFTTTAGTGVTEITPPPEEHMAQAFISIIVNQGPAKNAHYVVPATAAREVVRVPWTEGDWLIDAVRKVLNAFASNKAERVEVEVSGQQYEGIGGVGILELFGCKRR